jgi:hypothetical protein
MSAERGVRFRLSGAQPPARRIIPELNFRSFLWWASFYGCGIRGSRHKIVRQPGVDIMKYYIAFAIAGLVWLVAATPDANAIVCARGYYRSGCAGPRGAVVVHHPYGPRCYWRHGVRVCR